MNNTKTHLHQKCVEHVAERVNQIKAALKEAQNAANNETKSSAGDKHETGRAMAQLETEKLTGQLSEALKLEQVLAQINPKQVHKIVGLGSLVTTNNGNFYISVSIGKMELEKESYFVISPVSPIGKLLLTKKEKDSFSFNGKSYVILSLL